MPLTGFSGAASATCMEAFASDGFGFYPLKFVTDVATQTVFQFRVLATDVLLNQKVRSV